MDTFGLIMFTKSKINSRLLYFLIVFITVKLTSGKQFYTLFLKAICARSYDLLTIDIMLFDIMLKEYKDHSYVLWAFKGDSINLLASL